MLPDHLAGALLPWYDKNARELPWRQNVTPYRVWISEIMLQQTRIEAAKGYFARFTAALPDIPALAAADEETVLKLWEGLGYYSRARNLHKAAKTVMTLHGGQLPADPAALRALSGIGDYTAGAIASIAFGLPEPAVDGNVLRICSRLTCCPDSIGDTKVKSRFRDELRARYPETRCGDFTSALMELGETVCTPDCPNCDRCPLRASCGAWKEGRPTAYPVTPTKKPRRIQPKTVFLLLRDGKSALHKRPDRGLLAGLWEFPNCDGLLSADDAMRKAAEWGCDPTGVIPCGDAIHIFSHIEWHMTGYIISCGAEPDRFRWADETARRDSYAVPAAFRYYKTCLSERSIP